MLKNGINKRLHTDNSYEVISTVIGGSIIDNSKLPVIFNANKPFTKTASMASLVKRGPITLPEWFARTVGQGTPGGIAAGIGLPAAALLTLASLAKAVLGKLYEFGTGVYRVGKQVFIGEEDKPLFKMPDALSGIGPGDILGAAGLGLALYNIVKKYKEKKEGKKTELLKDYWPALLGLGAAGLGFWPRISGFLGSDNPPKK
jgi:hypothetical protein